MAHKVSKFIWQKLTTTAWLDAHEFSLHQATRGGHAVVEIPKRIRLRVESFCASRSIANALRDRFGGSIRRLPSDWRTRWLTAHRTKPLRVGKRLVVASEADGPDTLVIPAGAAFGTGEHATTAMSLRMLERITRKMPRGWHMLDVGTGSGILALAARRFRAGHVVGIDNDPKAIRTARQNARANSIRGIEFQVGDATRGIAGRFNIITANLFSELLEQLLPRFRKCLAADGRVVLSGVLRTQEAQVRRALAANHFAILETRRRGKWIALLAKKS